MAKVAQQTFYEDRAARFFFIVMMILFPPFSVNCVNPGDVGGKM
jgi:hypothetical protein